jgi:hypothetical protein
MTASRYNHQNGARGVEALSATVLPLASRLRPSWRDRQTDDDGYSQIFRIMRGHRNRRRIGSDRITTDRTDPGSSTTWQCIAVWWRDAWSRLARLHDSASTQALQLRLGLINWEPTMSSDSTAPPSPRNSPPVRTITSTLLYQLVQGRQCRQLRKRTNHSRTLSFAVVSSMTAKCTGSVHFGPWHRLCQRGYYVSKTQMWVS